MDFVKKFSILGPVVIASLAIAQSASARFVIFVAGNDFATLQRVRTVSLAAFATKINNQPAIQAGTFNSETSADSLAIALQQSGLSAQKYFRSTGGKENNVPVPFPETSNTTSFTSLPNPQQVVIQQSSIPSIPQPVSFQTEVQPQVISPQVISPQVISTLPQQAQYQQITTNAFIPQVQSQQVLVPRWQTQQIQPQSVQYQAVQSVLVTTSQTDDSLLPQTSQNPNFRYVAAVPAKSNNQFLLSRVRQYVPNAFFANSGRGAYIHAGAYQNRDAAESVSRYLRSQGVDSRVLYF